MSTRLYKFVNSSEIANLESMYKSTLEQWASDWMNIKHPDIKMQNAMDLSGFNNNGDPIFCNGRIAICLNGTKESYLSNLFGISELKASIDFSEVERVYSASLCALSEIFNKDDNDLDFPGMKSVSSRGSGWVVASIPLNNLNLKVYFYPRFPAKYEKYTQLHPIIDQIKPEKISVDVFMSGTEITAGELDQLQIGDVLELRHKVTDPLTVLNQSGDLVGYATLGKVNDVYAIGYFTHKP